MKSAAKKLQEDLTKLLKTSKIEELGEDEILALLQSSLNSIDDGDWNYIHQNIKPFQSFTDQIVAKIVAKKTDDFQGQLTEKEKAIEQLKSMVPRASDPDEIKKRLETETDPLQKQILSLEFNNAILQRKMAESESEKDRIKLENDRNALINKLSGLVKDKDLPIHDASIFATLGNDAESRIIEYGEKQREFLNSQLNKLASQKFGGVPQGGNDEKGKVQMSMQEIANIKDRGARLKAMEEAGI